MGKELYVWEGKMVMLQRSDLCFMGKHSIENKVTRDAVLLDVLGDIY